MAFSTKLSSAASFWVTAALLITSLVNMPPGVQGNCTVQNKSSKEVIILPVVVSGSIDVDVGASVKVPPSQQHCSFKNAESGHQLGPFTLTDGTLLVIIDGAISGTVDIRVAVYVLGILHLGASICVSL